MKEIQENETDKIRFSISLPIDVYDRYIEVCGRLKRSRSAQTLLLIEQFLNGLEPDKKTAPKDDPNLR